MMIQVRKILILVVLALWISTGAFSLSDFKKGFVITNNGDTLFGLVNYREGASAFRKCTFRESNASASVQYTPRDLKGYGFVDDRIFESREIKPEDEEPRVAFMEVLARGTVSLYMYENTYWAKKEAGLYELTNKIKEAYVNDKLVSRNSNHHIAILNMMMSDCEKLRTAVQKAKLQEKELTILVENYNQCKGDSVVTFREKKPWAKTRAGIVAGVNISELNSETNEVLLRAIDATFEVSRSPVVGISLDFLAPRVFERLSFHTDVLYLKSTYYHYNFFDTGVGYIKDYITIELQQIKIPLGFRYTFPQKKVTPYFNAGISTTIHVKKDLDWTKETDYNGTVETTHVEDFGIQNTQVGIWGGIGLTKSISDKFNALVEFRFEGTNGIYSSTLMSSKITNFQVMIGVSMK